MANYGSFSYGTSVVYGPGSTGSTISAVDILDKNIILVIFAGDVAVNDALIDVTNYTIEFSDNPGNTDVSVRSIYPRVGGSPIVLSDKLQTVPVSTNMVEIHTDKHTAGQLYTITIQNLVSYDGIAVPANPQKVLGRRTKVEAALRNLPSHFDKSPNSTVRGIITAIGREDDRIGGSLIEDIPI